MFVLAIDPGFANIGICYGKADKYEIIYRHTYTSSSQLPLLTRIKLLFDFFEQLLSFYPSTYFAYENPVFINKKQSADLTYFAIGIILLAVSRQKHPPIISKVTPSQIKKHIASNGKAQKHEIINIIKNKYSLEKLDSHQADAIALYDFTVNLLLSKDI